VRAIEVRRPSLVLLDLRLEGGSGLLVHLGSDGVTPAYVPDRSSRRGPGVFLSAMSGAVMRTGSTMIKDRPLRAPGDASQ
jgi:hypothetical protein